MVTEEEALRETQSLLIELLDKVSSLNDAVVSQSRELTGLAEELLGVTQRVKALEDNSRVGVRKVERRDSDSHAGD